MAGVTVQTQAPTKIAAKHAIMVMRFLFIFFLFSEYVFLYYKGRYTCPQLHPKFISSSPLPRPDDLRHRHPRRNDQQTEQNFPSSCLTSIIALFPASVLSKWMSFSFVRFPLKCYTSEEVHKMFLVRSFAWEIKNDDKRTRVFVALELLSRHRERFRESSKIY